MHLTCFLLILIINFLQKHVFVWFALIHIIRSLIRVFLFQRVNRSLLIVHIQWVSFGHLRLSVVVLLFIIKLDLTLNLWCVYSRQQHRQFLLIIITLRHIFGLLIEIMETLFCYFFRSLQIGSLVWCLSGIIMLWILHLIILFYY